jgi:hypothetical protein
MLTSLCEPGLILILILILAWNLILVELVVMRLMLILGMSVSERVRKDGWKAERLMQSPV